MCSLLEEIRSISEEAAHALKGLRFQSDSDIKSLDRQDLLELLPGTENLRKRKEIHKLICRRPKLENILIDLKDLFLSDLLADGSTDIDQYLAALCKIKECTGDLINFLEANKAVLPEKPSDLPCVTFANSVASFYAAMQGPSPEVSASYSNSYLQRITSIFPSFGSSSSEAKDTSGSHCANVAVGNISRAPPVIKKKVVYKMVVSGNTLDKHLDVIERLKGPVPGSQVSLQLTESQQDEDWKVTIVFCPVVSRVGTDVKAALEGLSSEKPIILVVMHHLHTPETRARLVPSGVELCVNVFFHEFHGLLHCPQNDEAINDIKTKLLEYSSKKTH